MGMNRLPGAVLFRQEDFPRLEMTLKQQESIDMMAYGCLEGAWWYFLPFDLCLTEPNTLDFLCELSQHCDVPLLYYWHMEDFHGSEVEESGKRYTCDQEGWGYRLFAAGTEQASLAFDYTIPQWREDFPNHVEKAVAKASPQRLQLMGVSQAETEKMVALLTPQTIIARMEKEDLRDIARDFQQLLGIRNALYT